jgi:hypothetical protein
MAIPGTYMVQYLHFRILKIPLTEGRKPSGSKALRVVPSRMDSVPFCCFFRHATLSVSGDGGPAIATAVGAVQSLAEVANSVAKLEETAGDKGPPVGSGG